MIRSLHHLVTVCIFSIIALAVITSCQEDEAITGNLNGIVPSTDTLRFDTVFTTTNTITQSILVFNTSDEPLILDRITLRDQSQGAYSININGIPDDIRNFRIEANDSLFIFVKANIDPMDLNNPFIVENTIDITSGGQRRSIALEAFGQDAIYIGSNTQIERITCDMGTEIWDEPKPYVVFGSLEVDSCVLEIPAGTNVFFHGSAFVDGEALTNDGLLRVLKHGSLQITGTPQVPVTLRSDRRDVVFEGRAAQWAGLFFEKESKNNFFSNARIQDAIVAVQMEDSTELSIDKSILFNSFHENILCQNANVNITNSLLYGSNNDANFQIFRGGNYNLEYTTISSLADGRNFARAMNASNSGCFDNSDCQRIENLDLSINNCIIHGVFDEEFNLDISEDAVNTISITNSLLRTSDTMDIGDFFTRDTFNINPAFVDVLEQNYALDSLSPVIKFGIPNNIMTDLFDLPRPLDSTSIGAIQF